MDGQQLLMQPPHTHTQATACDCMQAVLPMTGHHLQRYLICRCSQPACWLHVHTGCVSSHSLFTRSDRAPGWCQHFPGTTSSHKTICLRLESVTNPSGCTLAITPGWSVCAARFVTMHRAHKSAHNSSSKRN